MTGEVAIVFSIIVGVCVLMATNRVRYDIIAILVVLALSLSGVLSIGQALSGFGNPVVIMVAVLLVIGEMLDRTGVARAVGDWILKHGGKNETRLIATIMFASALLGSVMSSTAIVAIFIPIVLRISRETSLNTARLLLPMAYAALISGMLTLIATAPNLVGHEELVQHGFSGFSFFSFTPIGFVVLVVAVGYMLLIGRRFLPSSSENSTSETVEKSIDQLLEDFEVSEHVGFYKVRPDSALISNTIADANLWERFDTRILGMTRLSAGRMLTQADLQ